MQTGENGQTIGGFGGINLRVSRTALKDGDLARAVNADLHRQYGVAHLRAGRSILSSTLAGARIQRLARIDGIRYQLADNLYRNYTSIVTALTTDKGTLVPYRPLNDTTLWCFAAGQLKMYKDNGGSQTYQWGLTAPTAAPTVAVGAAGSLTGNYSIRFTYIRKVGSVVACESNPSPVSNTSALTADVLTLSGLTASGDAQVTHVRVYRTVANGAAYLFDQDIVNGTTTGTSSQADTALADVLEVDNDPPPTAYYAFTHAEHMFLLGQAANPHYCWFSKRFRPEQVPPENFLEIGSPDDPLLCGASMAGVAGVFTSRTKYLISGNTTSSFVPQEALSKRGIKAPNSLALFENGCVFMASDGVYVTNFTGPDETIGEEIEPLFYGTTVNGYEGINWDAKELFAGEVWKNRYYLSVATGTNATPNLLLVYSFDTKKWYWYDHPVTALFYEQDTEGLSAGLVDGTVVMLESGTTDEGDAIALEVESGDLTGEQGSQTQKLWLDATVEAHTQGENVTVQITIDDVLKSTQTITTSARQTVRLKLPAGCMGTRCRLTLTYTGSAACAVYGAAAYYLPLNAV
jgi:hypothetical protein